MFYISRAPETARHSWIWAALLLVLVLAAPARGQAQAQAADVSYTDAELQELVGPIALYPDDLLAIVLPASTYPLQIVQAARFLDDLEDNPNLEPDDEWDNAVVALLNYPEVLRMLDDDLDWTWALGEAVLSAQASVLNAIQDFRDRAYAAGNLQSDDRQVVTEDDGVVSIAPADPEVIYVPYYEPERVIVYQRYPVYHYYADPYPIYYYPYPVGYRFHTGFFWGVTSAFSIGWHTHYLHVHHHSHVSHPYYRRHYHTPYYARRGVNININLDHVSHVWQPSYRGGARPSPGYRRAYSREGYRSDQRRANVARRLPNPGAIARDRQSVSNDNAVAPSQRVYRNGNPQGQTQNANPRRLPPSRSERPNRVVERNAATAERSPAVIQGSRVERYRAPVQVNRGAAPTPQRAIGRVTGSAENRATGDRPSASYRNPSPTARSLPQASAPQPAARQAAPQGRREGVFQRSRSR